jgi:beta-N-acetylglucosaminidase
MSNENKQKSLVEVFKELEQNKNRQVEIYKNTKKQKEESSFIFHIKHRTKADNIKLIIIVLIVLLTFSLFSSNYIFAKDLDDIEEKTAIGAFEKNDNPKDVYAIIADNISNTYQKEIIEREKEIDFTIEYNPNQNLPEGEEQIIQEGIIGKKNVTYVINYENNEIVEENVIGENVLINPQTQIIEIGTSKILKIYNAHIGDNLFVSQDIELRKNANMESDSWTVIPAYYDVKVLEIIEDSWVKVSYNEKYTGYILCDYLTSEALSPGISELSRKTKLLNKVDINMELNATSGLTENDYKKILNSFTQDTNNIIKSNYKAFFDAENKYGINGVFLIAIAIHESNWGKSSLAVNKHNLFGFGAYDDNPYESAVTFENYDTCIDTVAAWLASNYIFPQGSVLKNGDIANGRYFNGPTVTGVNVKYASDPDWATKVFATMQNIYSKL